MQYIVTRDGIPVRDRGSCIITSADASAAIDTAKAIYTDQIAAYDGYKQLYDHYYQIACIATYSAKRV